MDHYHHLVSRSVLLSPSLAQRISVSSRFDPLFFLLTLLSLVEGSGNSGAISKPNPPDQQILEGRPLLFSGQGSGEIDRLDRAL